jgi:hypothetical protein
MRPYVQTFQISGLQAGAVKWSGRDSNSQTLASMQTAAVTEEADGGARTFCASGTTPVGTSAACMRTAPSCGWYVGAEHVTTADNDRAAWAQHHHNLHISPTVTG